MKPIKIILAVLLLLCLLDMPHGYYQLVRFLSFAVFGFFAFQENRREPGSVMVFIFGALALLFQPFFKISLGRELWNIVDVAVAAFLLWSAFGIRKEIE